MTQSLFDVPTRVAGIPCVARVTHYLHHPGSLRCTAPSDLDYYGYTEVAFQLCDRHGYPAAWLEQKMTDQDISRIEYEIMEAAC